MWRANQNYVYENDKIVCVCPDCEHADMIVKAVNFWLELTKPKVVATQPFDTDKILKEFKAEEIKEIKEEQHVSSNRFP